MYDGEGNLVEYIDKVTSVRERYRYQADGKLASTCHYTLNGTTMVLSDVVVYTYDANHNPSGSRYATLLNGRSYTRTTAVSYDSLNRVTGFSDNGVTSGYTYHLLGMTASASLSRGNTLIQYAYTYKTTPDPFFDGFERQTGLPESVTSTLKQGSTTRESNTFAYTYDDRDNITEIRIDGVLKYSYEYDYLDQLIRENNKVSNKTYLYTYDNAGNITSKKTYAYTTASTASLASTTATATYTYTYDSNWGDRLSSYRGASFAYDSLGNPTSYYNGSSYTMRWSKGRQLSIVTKGSSNLGFTYDAEGRRTSKLSTNGQTIQYVWDGDLLIGEYVVGQETITYSYDASGSPVGFTYTDLTGYYEGGVPCTFLYRKNPQGDIIGIVDWSGNEFVKYNYDAWGNLISYTMHGDGLYSLHYNMAEGNSFRYRGYYFDRETGFYYLKSRYYDPKIGRFLNADSQLNGSILGYNQYAYCENNPVMRSDSTGQWYLVDDLIAGFVGGVVGVASQFISDVVASAISGSWQLSNWETYFGSFGGGALGGVATLYGGPTVGAAVSSGFSTLIGQSLENVTGTQTRSMTNILMNSVTDSITGVIMSSLFSAGGLITTSGRNSMSAVLQSSLPKFGNKVTIKTVLKVISNDIASGIWDDVNVSFAAGIKSSVSNLQTYPKQNKVASIGQVFCIFP